MGPTEFECEDMKPVKTATGEVRSPGIWFSMQPAASKYLAIMTASYARGSSLDKTVGRNSATVGWMCMARCIAVYGALAYMTSSTT